MMIKEKQGNNSFYSGNPLNYCGHYYAIVSSGKNPYTFGITVNLKENIIPETLQDAVNSVMQRLPYMNVRLKCGFMSYFHKAFKEPPKIIKESDMPACCRFFEKGNNRLIRVIYGERNFSVETLHTTCDGSSFAWVVKALVVRYFELLGIEVNKDGVFDCDDVMNVEEIEDVFSRYKKLKKTKPEKPQKAYTPKYTPASFQIITQSFDLGLLKELSKKHGLTISEYIVTHMLIEFAKLREKDGSKKPVGISTAINCRRFIPTKSIKPFITNIPVMMPETTEFSEIASSIKKQFNTITSDYVFNKASNMERLFRIGKLMPLLIKAPLTRYIGNTDITNATTWLSNLGLIELPPEVQSRVESLSFILGPDKGTPYQFGCVSVGNTLTLTVSSTAKDNDVIYNIGKSLVNLW